LHLFPKVSKYGADNVFAKVADKKLVVANAGN